MYVGGGARSNAAAMLCVKTVQASVLSSVESARANPRGLQVRLRGGDPSYTEQTRASFDAAIRSNDKRAIEAAIDEMLRVKIPRENLRGGEGDGVVSVERENLRGGERIEELIRGGSRVEVEKRLKRAIESNDAKAMEAAVGLEERVLLSQLRLISPRNKFGSDLHSNFTYTWLRTCS